MRFRHVSAMLLLLAAPALAQDAQALARRADAEADAGFDLARRLGDEELFISPHSIVKALEMAMAGARGETLAELTRALRLEACGQVDLDVELSKRGKNARGRDGQPFRLRSVQAAFAQEGHPFAQAYLDTLRRRFSAEARPVDFIDDTEEAREAINDWVAEATEGKIRDMLAPGQLTAASRLVLANAIYFNAAWARPFQEQATRPRPFQLQGGQRADVPTMSTCDHFEQATVEGVRAVRLPYSGNETSMLILLPEAGRLGDLVRDLSAARLRAIDAALQGAYLDLRLPRFSVRSRADLIDPLKALGAKQAFVSGEADFSGVDGTRELFISLVLHEAVCEVDERGTEAAAATLVGMEAGGMPPEPTAFHVDRPFVFVIRDDATGAVLFFGRVLDPR
jgi:serpin B